VLEDLARIQKVISGYKTQEKSIILPLEILRRFFDPSTKFSSVLFGFTVMPSVN
jgi:hypothetical protein